jgi:hypothetical protein
MRTADPKTRVAGVFAYTKYVSLEFTKGVMLDDPHKVLEGAGKVRRHIKLHSLNDIVAKDCLTFLKASAQTPCLNEYTVAPEHCKSGQGIPR